MPIRLLCLSDIHSKVSSLSAILNKEVEVGEKRPDLIMISGDISHFGDAKEVERVLGVVDEAGIPYCYVLGNCDPKGNRMGVNAKGRCLESGCMPFKDLAVFGSGGSTHTPFGTPFEVDEEELIASIERSRSTCWGGDGSAGESCSGDFPSPSIMLVHNPPFGDIVDRTRSGLHVGSQKLRMLILEASPLLVHCGHIHEAAGAEWIGRSLVLNPGPAERGSYALVEIEMNPNGKGESLVNVVHQKV